MSEMVSKKETLAALGCVIAIFTLGALIVWAWSIDTELGKSNPRTRWEMYIEARDAEYARHKEAIGE